MKIKCPKCVSARHVRGTIDAYTCTKCKHSFTEDEGFF